MHTHIIPDIHGRVHKLIIALKALGFVHTRGAWRHPQGDTAAFLGDFIDRGPDNAAVIRIVRDMIEAGTAVAVIGNHELNAIQYHTDNPETGDGIKARTPEAAHNQRTFLDEFPLGSPRVREAIAWMQSLPIVHDAGDFRIVHACWDQRAVDVLLAESPDATLRGDLVYRSHRHDPFGRAVERLTKGPGAALPAGYVATDSEGVSRQHVRTCWWKPKALTWADAAMSVVNVDELPSCPPPLDVLHAFYPPDQKPVFFGHYWLEGAPALQAENVLCLDYSAGLHGPLVTYRHRRGDTAIDLANLTVHTSD